MPGEPGPFFPGRTVHVGAQSMGFCSGQSAVPIPLLLMGSGPWAYSSAPPTSVSSCRLRMDITRHFLAFLPEATRSCRERASSHSTWHIRWIRQPCFFKPPSFRVIDGPFLSDYTLFISQKKRAQLLWSGPLAAVI